MVVWCILGLVPGRIMAKKKKRRPVFNKVPSTNLEKVQTRILTLLSEGRRSGHSARINSKR
jgi:hypothetical protein